MNYISDELYYTVLLQRRSAPSPPWHGHGLRTLWTCGACGLVRMLVHGVVVFASGVEFHGICKEFD